MSAAAQVDWFSQNAPKAPPAPAQSQDDWFSTNAPKESAQPDSALKRYAGSISPLLTQNPADTLKATAEEVKHPKETAVNVAKGMNPYAGSQDAANIAMEQMKQPGIGNKVAGGIRYLASGIPFVGPSLVKAGEQAKSGDYAGMAGTITPIAVGAALSPTGRGAVADAATAVKEAPGQVREAIGAKYHDPVTGKLTTGGKAIGHIGGATIGGGLGLGADMATGGHYGVYGGGAFGARYGPELFDRAFPEPENIRMGRLQAAAQRIDPRETAIAKKAIAGRALPGGAPLPLASEFYENKAQDLMRRGREQEALDRKSARAVPKGKGTMFNLEGGTLSDKPVGNVALPPPSSGGTTLTGETPVKLVNKPEKISGKSKIVSPDSPAPVTKGSYWSFPEQALRETVMSGDRDAAVVYKQRFGQLPPGASYLTDIGDKANRGLYRSRR